MGWKKLTAFVEIYPHHVRELVELMHGTRADFVQVLRAALGTVHELRHVPEVKQTFTRLLERERRRK